ncbi:MAG: CRTAC1 family protein [Gammaproteobacteria bacterium]|nr:MAG: CRTAC1 family protein [Gammaproteobacteria bacterium]
MRKRHMSIADPQPARLFFTGLLLVAASGNNAAPAPPFVFSDQTEAAGFTHEGASFAAAAADFDGDGWPDLAVSNHGHILLFRNTQDGRFENVTNRGVFERADTHGLAWVDFNRDGWPDLYVSRGAELGRRDRANVLHINRQGKRFELAQLGPVLSNAPGRGRSAVPWDVDGDGKLDLFINNFVNDDNAQILAIYRPEGFVDLAEQYNWARVYASDVTVVPRRGGTLYVTHGHPRAGGRVWRLTRKDKFAPWSGRLSIPKQTETRATYVAAGDVDNDGDSDLYYVMRPRSGEGAVLADQTLRFLFLVSRKGVEKGFQLCATGKASLEFWKEGLPEPGIARLGERKHRLTHQPWHLSLESLMFQGEPEIAADETGLFLWRDAEGCLTAEFHGSPGELQSVGGRIRMKQSPESFEQWGTNPPPAETRNKLFIDDGDGFLEDSVGAGVDDPGPGNDAVFADFNNDGRLDLYVVNGGMFGNPTNRLYLNMGSGRFHDVTASAKAGGYKEGRGASVLVFDYDLDGDLDMFITNGFGPSPERDRGRYQLLRNDSDSGNWLRVQLKPTVSNSMGLGVRLVLQAGGFTQSRPVTAGTGAFATSWLPVHFGLNEEKTGTLTIHWPSGQTQIIPVKANTAIVATEPSPPDSGDIP